MLLFNLRGDVNVRCCVVVIQLLVCFLFHCVDLRNMYAPRLYLVSTNETVRVGQSLQMHCQVPCRSCCSFKVLLSHNGDYITYQYIKSERGFAKFIITNVQAWQTGEYRCQYSYRGVPQASPSSNTTTITVGGTGEFTLSSMLITEL